MTTRKIPPNLVTTPATGIVSEAPKAIEIPEHLQNKILFHQQVAKRFRLVPNFFVSAPDAPEIVEKPVGLCCGGVSRQPDPNTLQRTAFCLPLAFLSGPLLHCAPLRVSNRLWSRSG